jgi:predicted dehydrogenase
MQHTLLFLQPGHFHAALLVKSANERIAQDLHVYATAGDECDAFVALIDAFNSRDDSPTDWKVHVHDAPSAADALDALIEQRRGQAVVLSGRNDSKLSDIARLHAQGFWVIADKPWVTDEQSATGLEQACSGEPLAMDIMPDRHEFLARLRKHVVDNRELFGEFVTGDPQGPAIELSSTHHLYKIVNGQPLRRPAWYYDVSIQGDGIVDGHSHLTDQAQWLVGASQIYDFDADVQIDSARRWATPVPLELFRDSTGLEQWPDSLRPQIRDDVLHYACNGEIRYRLCGINVRQYADWGQREPVGGGDLHGAVLRGSRAVLRVDHGEHTNFVPEVSLQPRDGVNLGDELNQAIDDWQSIFPGLAVEPVANGYRFVAPLTLHTTHESHFANELGGFLDHMDSGRWPIDLQARIHTRHRLLTEALILANQETTAT